MRHLSDIVFNQHPVLLSESASVQEACERMREARVGSVLVTDDDGNLVGIFTGRDAVTRVLAQDKRASDTRLGEVMTAEPTTMKPSLTAIEALRTMWECGFRHLPICEGGKIVGIVSRGDFKGAEQDRLDEEVSLWQHMR
jgi:CBS domain-containing protein